MDKLKWLQTIVLLHPEDAEAHYWLGQELEQCGQALEALQIYSAALAVSQQETQRLALIQAISSITSSLQAGSPVASLENNISAASGFVAEPEIETFENEDLTLENKEQQVHTGRAGLTVFSGGKDNAVAAQRGPAPIKFNDVAGLHKLKKTIQLRIISPFQNQSLFSKFRKKAGGGVLLYGPPGCGKTFITRATAGECQANFIPVSITDILDPYIGVSEQNLKDLFDKARSRKPSIMFFDEIDTLGYNRSKSSSSMRGVIDTFLTEMEGIDTNTDQILVIGATNMPWDVDSALKRPGRFDRLVFVAPPDEEAREQIFRLKLADRYMEGIDIPLLAAKTEFFSGADIENLCERAAEQVLEEILETGVERPIRMSDVEAVLQEVRPSTMEWLRTAKNYVKYSNQSGIYNDVEEYLKKFGRRI
ncbi:cell division protein [Paenibacillus borealis]|uniref:Cell division protein n=1 Tax=Paenibacillus borealis TaxID=160799 RepID=A0ABX3H349_PAEBO|nr:ATP-binding protein [Paenibacillus borealis]OMD44787.1 cell division protein [Paenibacillus borealis]